MTTALGWMLAVVFAVLWLHARMVIYLQDDLIRAHKRYIAESDALHEESQRVIVDQLALLTTMQQRPRFAFPPALLPWQWPN